MTAVAFPRARAVAWSNARSAATNRLAVVGDPPTGDRTVLRPQGFLPDSRGIPRTLTATPGEHVSLGTCGRSRLRGERLRPQGVELRQEVGDRGLVVEGLEPHAGAVALDEEESLRRPVDVPDE
jgi:hypothetical protein